MRAIYLAPIAALAMQLAACLPVVPENKPPVAAAVAKVGGMALGTAPIPFDGSAPVMVVLDGSASTDPDKDGKVVAYKWLRTDISAAMRNSAGAAGMGSGGAPASGAGGAAAASTAPAFTADPPATASPTITLTEKGKYRFSLWVKDDKGAFSAPASVSFQVGGFMPDAMCVETSTNPKPECEACICTPTAQGGCLMEFNSCVKNTDPMFAMLCGAIVKCAIEKKCTGTACYTNPAGMNCMAEIDAAVAFTPGGTAATSCVPAMAAMNPCGASNALTACTAAPTCAAVCGSM